MYSMYSTTTHYVDHQLVLISTEVTLAEEAKLSMYNCLLFVCLPSIRSKQDCTSSCARAHQEFVPLRHVAVGCYFSSSI